MDRIETFQDLLNLLDSKPEWVEELRVRLLTPELIALPEQLARFAETVNKRFDVLEERQARTEKRQDRTEGRQDRMEARQDRMEKTLSDIQETLSEVQADVGDLKGLSVPLAARRMVGKIAEVTNSRRPRWLEITEIIDIADDADTAEVPLNELESFRAIDLALTAIDKSTGTQNYIIIECSYSVDSNDVERAKRNAEYMTQFTSAPAKAVVMGNRIPEEVARAAEQTSVACVTVTNKSSRPR